VASPFDDDVTPGSGSDWIGTPSRVGARCPAETPTVPGRGDGTGVWDDASEVTSSVASTVTSSDGSTVTMCDSSSSSLCSFVIWSDSESSAEPLAASRETGGLVVISPTSLLDRQGS